MLSIAKKLFNTFKEKIKNNLEILIIFNFLLLYYNSYTSLIIVTNITILALSKNNIIKGENTQICSGEFSEIEGKLYDENNNLIDSNIYLK